MNCDCYSHNGFLTERGYELAQQMSLEGLTPFGDCVIVDKSGSVSALVEVEVDCEYDPEHTKLNRRFIHVYP